MDIDTVFRRELRIALRQRSFFLFTALFFLMLGIILLIQRNVPDVDQYTNMTGTMMNVTLYLLPLIGLLLGSFSIAQEKEDGNYRLLLTYPLSPLNFLAGKFSGQLVAQWVALTFCFGLAGLASFFLGHNVPLTWLLLVYLFSLLLVCCFLAAGILIGTIAANRWQALSLAILLWFLLIMIWPLLVLSVLGLLPFPWIQPAMTAVSACNPAEWLRFLLTVQFGGGAVFGQPYYRLVAAVTGPSGHLLMGLYTVVFSALQVVLAALWMRQAREVGKHGRKRTAAD